MAGVVSAGLLMYARTPDGGLQVLLVHPGGPFFAKKDRGFWSIPKGLPEPGEALCDAAKREFEEEIGIKSNEPLIPVGAVRQKSGKTVHAWAFEGALPAGFAPASNTFELEWPPRSGRRQHFPEIDRAEMVPEAVARERLNAAQVAFLDRLREALGLAPGAGGG